MKTHVKKVMELWKNPYQEGKSKPTPYPFSQQLNKMAGLFSPGQFYYYIVDFPNLKMEYVHQGTQEVLGIPPEEANMASLVAPLVPESREAMFKKEAVVVDFMFNYLPPSEVLNYKSVYFATVRDTMGTHKTLLHQANVLSLCEENRPKHILVVHTDVSHFHLQRKDSLSLVNLSGGESFHEVPFNDGKFDALRCARASEEFPELTEREREVIRKMAEGHSTEETADQLCISVHTLRTHRKNILRKSGCRNTHELVARSLMAGVI